MSHQTAEKLTRETGRHIEWAPANREYVIWPEGIPCQSAAEVRRRVAELNDYRIKELEAELEDARREIDALGSDLNDLRN